MEAEFVIINVYYQGIDQFFALIDETQVMKFTEFIFLFLSLHRTLNTVASNNNKRWKQWDNFNMTRVCDHYWGKW